MSDKKFLKSHCCSTYYQDEDDFVNQQAISRPSAGHRACPHRGKTETPSFPSNYVMNIPTENIVMLFLFSSSVSVRVWDVLSWDGYMYRVQSLFWRN
jgi:hypothetical protein